MRKTVSQRVSELTLLSKEDLVILRLSYSVKAPNKRIAAIKAMRIDALIEDILSYELGAAIIDWDQV